MKKRQLVSLALGAAMVTSMTACNVQTKSDTTSAAATTAAATQGAQQQGGETAAPAADPNADVAIGAVNVKLLYQGSDESVANVVRDELSKAGITVEMAPQADGASFREQEKNGNFDIAISSWANPVGTPDYGCRGIWHSKGDSNIIGINDPNLDKLVEDAAMVTADKYVEAYGAAEDYAVGEMCYMSPLYIGLTGRGASNVIDQNTITNNQRWEKLAYVDESQRETRTLNLTQTGSSITTWDPIRADDQSSGYALDHMYIHLVTLQPDWSVTTDSSLSYNYAIADGNSSYYFILRDDCGFARIDKDGNAYDSGVKVAGEDVVYSLNRAKDKDSIPMHLTYSMFENLDTVEIVTDAAELESVKTAEGKTIKEVLEAGLPAPISSIVEARGDVDNAAGKYQVIRCNTKVPYPQIFNCLTFHGAGIVDSEWVENINKNVDFAAYDATKDRLYGDSVTTMEASFDNQLSLSGSYVLTSMNDYQMNFTANPCIRTNDANYKPIKTIVNKFIADKDAALSALRSGDVDFPYSIPATKYDIVEADPNLTITKFPGIRVYMLAFNMHGNSEVSNSVDLRKAIASCIKFDEINAVQAGNAIDCYSALGSCLDTGKRTNWQPGDTEKYLKAYFATK